MPGNYRPGGKEMHSLACPNEHLKSILGTRSGRLTWPQCKSQLRGGILKRLSM
jgi:hypothetical protein